MITVRVKALGDLKGCLKPYLERQRAGEKRGNGAMPAEAVITLMEGGEGGYCVGDLLFVLGLQATAGAVLQGGVADRGAGLGMPFAPAGTVGLLLVNGKWAQPGDVLRNGDVVALYPPVGGG